MAIDPRDLTTIADLQAWLGMPDAAATPEVKAQLQRLVTAVSIWIQSFLSRRLTSQEHLEIRDGHGGCQLVLSHYPVTAVGSLVVDGRSISPSPGPGQPGWVLADDSLILRGFCFAPGLANVEITYTAGFLEIPSDLAQACLELAAMRWKERDRIGHVSKSIGGETVTFLVKDMPADVATILNQYRKVVPV